ncbi:NAD(P)H-hydrate epimerase [Actinomyces minihominis]|uniref:NAD(P)H-hydrate epimerase n=1 Tax=Actinomyces minihominis TaxID=2002838 RepID=UPI000C06EEE7|nr:NAD(P)H-hydrate epimerase [Actinomyces minihominis]
MATELVPVYTAAQVIAAEKPLLAAWEPLMARAAHGLARFVLDNLPGHPAEVRVLVLVGSGNNGGDALYAAAHLAEAGVKVDVLPVSSSYHLAGMDSALAATARRVNRADLADLLRGEVVEGDPEEPAGYDLIIDGIVGTGTSADPTLRGPAAEVVEEIWEYLDQVPVWPEVIAVDLPSGLDPDTGQASGTVLAADVTVTFGGVKSGLVAPEALWLVGEIVLVDIGLQEELDKVGEVAIDEVAMIIDETDWPPAS